MPPPVCAVDRLGVALLGPDSPAPLVTDVSFRIERGGYFALVGESGSGKSVTCHALLRLLAFPSRITGSAVIDGIETTFADEATIRSVRRRKVGMIFQDPLAALNPVRTIGSQLIETLRLHHPTDSLAGLRGRAVAALARMRIPEPEARLAAYPHQLSGGLNQRVMIALALAGDPPLLIADEPTTALDMSVQAEILDLLDTLRSEQGLSILLVTHDLGIVQDRADAIGIMQGGRLIEAGTTEAILANPREAYTRTLLDAARIGHPAGEAVRADPARPLLAFRGVNKRFRVRGGSSIVAAESLDFTVQPAEIVALVGESGSGKTTAAKMAVGLVRPDSGTIEMEGGRTARSVQVVFQHPKDSLDPLMRIGDQMHEVLSVHGERDAAARERRIREVIDEVGFPPAGLARRPAYLSGGEAQRAVIARALLLKPRLLIADEPLSAVDVSLQKQILACFRNLRAHLGIAILLVTHDLRIVADIADRVIVLREGRILEDVPTASFFDGARHPYAQRLIDAIPGRLAAPSPAKAIVAGSRA